MYVSSKYQLVLNGYLRWSTNEFLRPELLPFDNSSPTAAECMLKWESYGIEPISTSEPELLSDYVQGKKSRDYYITEWKSGIKDGLFVAEEFYLSGSGIFSPIGSDKEFETIFGRLPRKGLIEYLESVVPRYNEETTN